MPSTGWNVFVASLVALVVYIAVQAEMVLLGVLAGTLTFVSGWLLGYAINHDMLNSMEPSRIVAAGGVTVFAIVWTLLYSQQRYLLGLIVVCLAWFAAWFTSSMGPIKGSTGAMETIDEPQPPAGSEPGEQIHLGGPEEQYNDDEGGGFVRGLLGFGSGDDSTEYTTEPETAAEDTSTTDTQSSDTQSSPTTSEGSIFGLGIFYEGEPEPSAGADEQAPTRTQADQDAEVDQASEEPDYSPTEAPVEPPDQQRDVAGDHTRPSSTGAEYDPNRGASTGASGGADTVATADREADADTTAAEEDHDEADEPPEEHRVDVAAEESGFVFE